MPNKFLVGNIDYAVKELLKARFIHESDANYPKDALHLFTEDELAIKRNEDVLNDLPGEPYKIEASYKIPENRKYPLVTIQTNTSG